MALRRLTKAEDHKRDIMRRYGLHNAKSIVLAGNAVGLPLYAAAALMEKESMGKNIYGHDGGGYYSWYGELRVTEANFAVFYDHVVNRGYTSNGVGPSQITWRGYFPDMKRKGLRAWVPYDNMKYGMSILRSHYNASGHSWVAAGRAYNGAEVYGVDLAHKITTWQKRLA